LIHQNTVSMGKATASVVRRALEDFKKSGKFIVAYADYYSQNSYYLASTADRVYVNPAGGIEFEGFASQVPYLKDMLDRLGIHMQIYYAGQFKSATEPLRATAMSPQNRLQITEYLSDLYNQYLDDIGHSRKMTRQELFAIANEFKVQSPADAVKYKLADTEGYFDQVITDLKTRMGLKEKDKLSLVTLDNYAKGDEDKDSDSNNKIAVVYAEGEIDLSDDAKDGSIEGNKYAKIIRRLRQDDKVKAIVLRVNSGGGSALASDLIWRELKLARETNKKPVIVSMGDVAASGGYYIACMADTIFAEPNTITGSIGVFSVIPSFEKTLKEKVGIRFDTVKTARFAAMNTVFRDFDPAEAKILQTMTDSTYERFLQRVAQGRHKTRDEIHAIAQGRVWTGVRAKANGLVDKLGGLDDAIQSAVAKAGLKDYKTVNYPRPEEPFKKLIDKLTGNKKDQVRTEMLKTELGAFYPYYQQIRAMGQYQGVQMRLPSYEFCRDER
jgi:protease IV